MLYDNSKIKNCRDCRGTGLTGSSKAHDLNPCNTCKGSGKYKEEHYIIESNGIAMDSDFAGK